MSLTMKAGEEDVRLDERPTKASVKAATTKMMKALLLMTNTLDELPAQRYLSMRLHYNSNAPDDYVRRAPTRATSTLASCVLCSSLTPSLPPSLPPSLLPVSCALPGSCPLPSPCCCFAYYPSASLSFSLCPSLPLCILSVGHCGAGATHQVLCLTANLSFFAGAGELPGCRGRRQEVLRQPARKRAPCAPPPHTPSPPLTHRHTSAEIGRHRS